MKSRDLLFIILLSFLIVPHLRSQTADQKLYRLYAEDKSLIQNIESTGVNVYDFRVGKYVDIIATPQQAEQLKGDGLRIEFLANDFVELSGFNPELKTGAGYHDYQETVDELNALAIAYPNITRLDTIGESVLGRHICRIKISDNPELDEDEPPILMVGNHHANEVLSIEATLFQINYLLENYGVDQEVTDWVNNMEIWYIPTVNPDGREAVRRTNENGVDLNRNYGFQHTAEGNHGLPFSEPETQAVRDHAAEFPPIMSLTYHTSGQLVLYAWTHTDEGCPDSTSQVYLGNIIAESIPTAQAPPNSHYELRQGGRWYFTAGEYCDYMYAIHNTMAFTVEMWTRQTPDASVIPAVVQANLGGMIALFRQVNKAGVTGLVTEKSSGEPLVATIDIPSIDDQGKLSPRMTDAVYGRYYRYLAPGDYEISITAPGYRTIIQEITISADSLIHLNVEMEPAPIVLVDEVTILDNESGSIIGNGNGEVNLGERLGLLVNLVNNNSILARSSSLKIYSSSPYLNIIKDSVFYGDIASGQTVQPTDTLLFELAPNCPDAELIDIELIISDNEGPGWSETISIEAFTPSMILGKVTIDDSNANSSGTFDNGEVADVVIEMENQGRQAISSPILVIETEDPYFVIHVDHVQLTQIGANQKGLFTFLVELSEVAPNLHLADFKATISGAEGYTVQREFRLHNIRGFYDDFESGVNGWTHGSYQTTSNNHDDWQLGKPAGKAGDPDAAYSGENCWGTDMGWEWYANDTWNGEYQSNVYNYLKSPVIDCSGLSKVGLRYMRWLNTRIRDYGRILVNGNEVWKSEQRGHSDYDWTEETIDISQYADNNPSVIITFELESNSSGNLGGWNIDDVIIAHGLSGNVASETIEIESADALLDCYPNPFTHQLTIPYYLFASGDFRIDIYDSFGRGVRNLLDTNQTAGSHQIHWDGTGDKGDELGSGQYFVRMTTKNGSIVKGVMLLK